VNHHLEPPIARGRFEICQDVHQIAVPLVIVPVDTPSAIVLAELEQKCGEIVGKLSVIEAKASERMPNQDIKEQRLRW